jgi:hypothetical protein
MRLMPLLYYIPEKKWTCCVILSPHPAGPISSCLSRWLGYCRLYTIKIFGPLFIKMEVYLFFCRHFMCRVSYFYVIHLDNNTQQTVAPSYRRRMCIYIRKDMLMVSLCPRDRPRMRVSICSSTPFSPPIQELTV